MKLSILLAAIATLVGCCKAFTVSIQSVDDFLNFTQRVNYYAETYEGTTVLLETDLDMTGIDDFEPVGSEATGSEAFSGVFDGQGHHIGNLTFVTSERVSGIFGYTISATISNLIVDDTCTIVNNFVLPSAPVNQTSGYIGGIVGHCVSLNRECVVSNCSFHGDLVYNGKNTEYGSHIGGIIGMCRGDRYDCIVRDSISTGHITAAGDAHPLQNIVGGIVGSCIGSFAYNSSCKVEYSVSTGGISHSGTSVRIVIGGIAGACGMSEMFASCTINKCIYENAEAINVTTKTGTRNVGGLAGIVVSDSVVKDSYWAQPAYEDGVGFYIGGKNMSNCKRYNNSVLLSTPWKLAENMLAVTSGDLINVLAKLDMIDWIKEWVESKYTVSFVSNTYDNIKSMSSGFLEDVSVVGIVPQNPKDEYFGGWFVSDSFIFKLPDPCVLRKNVTVYGYWTAYPEVDDAPLYGPLKIILSVFLVYIIHSLF